VAGFLLRYTAMTPILTSCHINCLCSAIFLPGTLLTSPTLPVPTEICHCNPCRYSSGSLLPAFPTLNSAPPPEAIAKLTPYQTSRNCIRYFCTTCGAHCFVAHPITGEWYCTGGW